MNEDQSLTPPAKGFRGYLQSWKQDLLAAFFVTLVALPLSLGIALASGAPLISGLISAILAGILTTLYRGGHISIHGPGAGLVSVTLAGIMLLADDPDVPFSGWSYVLAAIVCAGGIQILMGLFKMGGLGNIVPAAVINGMLAAIGVIILVKQLHVAMGGKSGGTNPIGDIATLPDTIMAANPVVTLISIVGLLLLIFHSKIKNKVIHFIPGPLWVLIFSLPLAFFFDFSEAHNQQFLGSDVLIGPQYLIDLPDFLPDVPSYVVNMSIPEEVSSKLFLPDFSKANTFGFWGVVFSITLVGSIITLLASKAVEKLDPYKRKTNLNKDLIGVGFSSAVSGLLGGLPIITVIVRSSVNVNHGARTKASNFYHGLFILIIVLFLAQFMEMIPLAALATILVYTGYKLASPKSLRDTYRKGWEQGLVMLFTLLMTLIYGLILGVVLGIILSVFIHLVKSSLEPFPFFRQLFRPVINENHHSDGKHYLRMGGILNFVNLLQLIRRLGSIPSGEHVIFDLTHTRLVDYTTMEYVNEYAREYNAAGGKFDIIGLSIHHTTSEHPNAMQVNSRHRPAPKTRLSHRESRLKEMAEEKGYEFKPDMSWDTASLKSFKFFSIRPLEHKNNRITGTCGKNGPSFELSDVTFDEGVFYSAEIFHSTIQEIHLPSPIPVFTLEREEMFDRLAKLTGEKDIASGMQEKFSERFLLKGPEEQKIRNFFTDKLIEFLERKEIYHIESNGDSIIIFRHLRLASAGEVKQMVAFSEAFLQLIDRDCK